jgi:hypothetical protein
MSSESDYVISRFKQRLINDAAHLDRIRTDAEYVAEELSGPDKVATKEVDELRQLATSAARLSYDIKAHLRAHPR